ncbi:MAG: GNAT family N-acetyltransferase [Anaerolineae bacterium]|nr:GNAT family N-acetyltransferase [Anaerolineae bacterium]
MLARRIEEAGLNAWPALQQMLYDGWVLRFSKGYTKRANSANALYPSAIDTREKVAFCEARYRARELRPIFRITPFAPADLDGILEARGYELVDTTLVLHLDLDQPTSSPSEQVRQESLDDWLPIFCRLKSSSLEDHRTHREILKAILGRCFYASLTVSGEAISCALGVLEGEFFGLFDVVTAPEHRNKGHGMALLSSMLDWAQENGARHAYLGVVELNSPARRLYDKLGFQEVYRYWYRVPNLGKVES